MIRGHRLRYLVWAASLIGVVFLTLFAGYEAVKRMAFYSSPGQGHCSLISIGSNGSASQRIAFATGHELLGMDGKQNSILTYEPAGGLDGWLLYRWSCETGNLIERKAFPKPESGEGVDISFNAPEMRMLLSPDARRVAYVLRPPGLKWGVYALDLSAGTTKEVLSLADSEGCEGLWWRSSSQLIALVRTLPGESRRLVEVNVESALSATVMEATEHKGSQLYQLSVSPDGKYAALVIHQRNQSQVVIRDLSTGNESHLNYSADAHPLELAWSPDSLTLAFVTARPYEVKVVRAPSLEPVCTAPGSAFKHVLGPLSFLDSERLVCGTWDGGGEIVELVVLSGHTGAILNRIEVEGGRDMRTDTEKSRIFLHDHSPGK